MTPLTKSPNRFLLGAFLLAAQCSWSSVVSASTTYEGYGTVYTLSSPSDGNCNFMSWPSDAETKYAALNADLWDETMNCGRCAEVTCTDSSCSGQSSEVVYIMDQCPGCSDGDLDLSPDVFDSITGQSYTKLSIEWKFVDCPLSNNVQYCLKTGSSEFWVAVQPTNFVSGVKSLTINNQETTVIDSAYYFLIDGSGESVADLSSVSISLTGLNGEVLEETLSLTADECTDGSSQFSSSGDSTQTSTDTQTDSTSQTSSATTSAPTTAASTSAPTTSAAPTSAPTTEAPTATPTSTSAPMVSLSSAPALSSSGSSSYLRSSNSASASAVADHDTANSGMDTIAQVSGGSGSTSVEAMVTKSPSTVESSTSTPVPTVQSNVMSSGGSHSTPLMIGMIILVCFAVFIAVGLALYVRRRKKQIDAYKRREEQGTAMSAEDTSPRASDASSAFDVVHSPSVHYTAMNSL